MILALAAALAGALLAALLACLPGLHIYSVMGSLCLAVQALWPEAAAFPSALTTPFVCGLTVGYAVAGVIPSILLAAPDESLFFTVLPGQKWLAEGRGREAVRITSAGGMVGLCAILAAAGLAPRWLPAVHAVTRPHVHWILWCVICFLVLSEWPKTGPVTNGGIRGRMADGWRTAGMGVVTFLLSGFLGCVVLYRSPMSLDAGFQGLMPVFTGLFTLPWLILNLLARCELPPQHPGDRPVRGVTTGESGRMGGLWPIVRGSCAGLMGGGFAAFIPVLTGGVGGLLAGHAAAIRNDREFLASQGASRVVYYAGGLMLFFVPGLKIARGGAAHMLSAWAGPAGPEDYLVALGAMAVGGAASFLLVEPLSRGVLRMIERRGYRGVSTAALCIAVLLVLSVTGWTGLGVMLVSGSVGLIPVVFGARRMNCLGVILLPLAFNMSGVGPAVGGWLGLM